MLAHLKPARRWLAHRTVGRVAVAALTALALLPLSAAFSRPAHAMQIQNVKSPGGLEAWLVEEHGNPMMALRRAEEG